MNLNRRIVFVEDCRNCPYRLCQGGCLTTAHVRCPSEGIAAWCPLEVEDNYAVRLIESKDDYREGYRQGYFKALRDAGEAIDTLYSCKEEYEEKRAGRKEENGGER